MPTWPPYALFAILAVVFAAGAVWGIAHERERAKRAYRWPCWRCGQLELRAKGYAETKR